MASYVQVECVGGPLDGETVWLERTAIAYRHSSSSMIEPLDPGPVSEWSPRMPVHEYELGRGWLGNLLVYVGVR